MIINVRGTHGSGKSTLVRAIMEQHYDSSEVIRTSSTGMAHSYLCRSEKYVDLVVHGNYAPGVGGGCDHLKTGTNIFDPLLEMVARRQNVLYEGVVAQHSVPKLLDMRVLDQDVHVIALTTPIDVCYESVVERKRRRGDFSIPSRVNIEKESQAVASAIKRLRKLGVTVYERDRQEALDLVLSLLSKNREVPKCVE